MATTTSGLNPNTTGSDATVVGYFAHGEDAHRAINALLDEGFLASQIGAAFHVGPEGSSSEPTEHAHLGSGLRTLGTTLEEGRTNEGVFGAESDTTGIAPGMTSGAGTAFEGAGKPGPISGSNLSHLGMRSELTSELVHETPHESASYGTSAVNTPSYVETTSVPSHSSHVNPTAVPTKHGSWFEKLKHVFTSDSAEKQHRTGAEYEGTTTPQVSNKTSQSFGTGEGYIDLGPSTASDFAYSQPAFENSFSGFGVAPEHARHLSHRLRQGGAIVTVSVTGRAIDVEKVFERHNGKVHLETEDFNETELTGDHRVEVFGSLGHVYNGHVSNTKL